VNNRETERRRYSRGGLFARIEDVTYRVLRGSEDEVSQGDDPILEFADGTPIGIVNVTAGLSDHGQLGEPF
jgi:hypothetical protein